MKKLHTPDNKYTEPIVDLTEEVFPGHSGDEDEDLMSVDQFMQETGRMFQ